jgi:hypothetical protein
MCANRFLCICAVLLITGLTPSLAQSRGKQASAPAMPYTAVAIAPPNPMTDDSFEAMRKRLGEAAQRKDRAAMMRLVAQGFFWDRENRNAADKRKSGFENLSAALGLNNKAGAGWEILSGYVEDPTASPSPQHDGAICAPAEPVFDRKEFTALLAATNTDTTEWGYPLSPGIEVRATPQATGPVVDKIGMHLVRIMPDRASDPPSYMRIATPAGKAGFVSIDSIAPIGNDQICYVKEGGAWKIGGYVGGGEPQ